MIDTAEALKAFIDDLPDLQRFEPSLYIDLEGNDLSRKGTLSLVTILVEPRHTVHLVDVTKLGKDAFHVAGTNERSLGVILGSSTITKVFFDIRNDSDALFSLFGINVGGVEDLQLMELASRDSSKRCTHGLAKCIERDSQLSYLEKRDWAASKDKGREMFDPSRGGSYAVFDQRPLSKEMQEYCMQDVLHMPSLREHYRAKLCDAWWRKIEEETAARITLSQGWNYNGKGRHMALGPPGWQHWAPSSAERLSRTLLVKSRDPPEPTSGTTESVVPSRVRQVEDQDSGPSEPVKPSVSRALQQNIGSPYHDGSDFEPDHDMYSHWHRSDSDSDYDRDHTGGDLTACDSECGYCGRCMY